MTIIADQCQCGIHVVDDILEYYGIAKVEEAEDVDPLTDVGFMVLVGVLTKRLVNATQASERAALTRALASLQRRDWGVMSMAEREQAISNAAAMLPNATWTARRLNPIFSGASKQIVSSTRRSTIATHNLTIGADLNLTDKRIAQMVAGSQAHFITDRVTGRNEAWSLAARRIVADGVSQGLDRVEIAGDLGRALGPATQLGRSEDYYQVISSVFVGRARTGAMLSSFSEAGIRRYVFTAVMDQRTSVQCRFMDGHVFNVSSGLQRYQQIEQSPNPEAVRDITPWPRTRRNAEGQEELFVRSGGVDQVLATVTRNAVGRADDRGAFANAMLSRQLEALGVSYPPAHPRCRSVINPVF